MSQIDLTPVQSSRIAAIGFCEDTFTLAIRFPGTKKAPAGKVYHYKNVAPEAWEDLQAADSKGGWFNANILNNEAYPFECVDEGTSLSEDLQKQEFQSEIQEAEYWGKNQDKLAGEFEQGAANGTLGRGTKQASEVYLEPVAVPEPKEKALKARALEVQKEAQVLIIANPAAYAQAAERLKQVVIEKKNAQARVDAIKKPAYTTYQETLKLEKDVITPYAAAEKWLKDGMARYLAAEEAERRRKEAELAAENRRKAQEEADRKAKEIADQDAKILEAQGEKEVAAQVRSNPMPIAAAYVAPVVLQKEVPNVTGVSSRKNWSFRIANPDLVPNEYKVIDDKKIRAVVKALGDKANIAGVEVYEDTTIAVRA
jgi:hypothetical protein